MNNVGRQFVKLGIAAVAAVIVGWLMNYFALPAMTFSSGGLWWFGFVELLVILVCYLICDFSMDDYGTKHIGSIITGVLFVVWTIVFIVTAIAGSEMVNPHEYQQVAQVEEGNYEDDIMEVDPKEIVIVDVKTARKLGDRKLGSLKHPSWYEVNPEYNLVTISGVDYRISPIDYGGLFKYNKASHEGIPGYIRVSANTQDSAELIYFEEPMKYSPSAFWAYDLSRHLRNCYSDYIFAKSFFEVDDENNPYWITGVMEPTIGMRGGLVIKSVVITDAITGKNAEYKIDELPGWVDHAQGVNYLMEQASWHFGYTEGFFNFSKTNVFRTSYYYRDQKSESTEDNEANAHTPFEGYNSVKMKDGTIWFYTGITPANNAETNVGFLLLNPRNGVMKYYKLVDKETGEDTSGAEESSAQKAAEGLVSNMKYSASFPTILNVDGEETYFMTMKDAAGLVQRYALCNVRNYARCVCASTIEEALRLYRVEMGFIADTPVDKEEDNKQPSQDENREYKEVSGNVVLVNEAQIDGYTYYYFMVDGETTIFMSSIENSNWQPVKLVVGATVKVKYYASTEDGIGIVTEITFEKG